MPRLPGLLRSHPGLNRTTVLLLKVQEAARKAVTPTPWQVGPWTLVLFKHDDDEWRGQGIAGAVASRTAWWETTEQGGEKPSRSPYNTSQQPRRLDYIITRGLLPVKEGQVFERSRAVMGSDHDAVRVEVTLNKRTTKIEARPSTCPRKLVAGPIAKHLTLSTEVMCEWLQEVSRKITAPQKHESRFQESDELKVLHENRGGPLTKR